MTVEFEIAAENQPRAADPLRRPWSTPRIVESELGDAKAKTNNFGVGEFHFPVSESTSTVS